MKAVIVCAQRSGGLFLAGCLSNHPEISCAREEPFKREAIWQQKLKLSHGELLDFVLSQPFYKVSACRLTYDQIFNPEIAAYIEKHKVKIIHLTRMIMPVVTSTLLAKQEMRQGIKRHWVGEEFIDDEILQVEPEQVLHRVKHLLGQRRGFNERFGAEHLQLRYEDITRLGWVLPQEEADRICYYLKINPTRMITDQRKMHRRPLQSYYQNWPEIELALESAFPELVVI